MTKKQNPFSLTTYQFHLPAELIAQYPAEPRDSARLLVLDRNTGEKQDRIFTDVTHYLKPGDTLVLNRTRVIPARLYGQKDTGARVEILLLHQREDKWEALVRPAKRLKPGSIVRFGPDSDVEAEIVAELDTEGGRLIAFKNCSNEAAFINEVGNMPLPPYINRPAEAPDKEYYQTVYARDAGSAAAPTAGLHFTDRLLKELEHQGVNLVTLVLHVGLGTFRPVKADDIRNHTMHYEHYYLDEEAARQLNETRRKGKNIVAVGTTVVRTLETIYNKEYGFLPGSGETNMFIYPGYKFKAIDQLITNFHLPGSSLIMLVAALAGIEQVMSAYQYAVEKRYRFFSYGDAMLIK